LISVSLEATEAEGVLVYDDLLFGEQHIKQYPFLLVKSWQQSKFQQVDGVIGLSKTYWSTEGFA
jgi:hypothetical protein